MLGSQLTASAKRTALRVALAGPTSCGCRRVHPLTARLIQDKGFEGSTCPARCSARARPAGHRSDHATEVAARAAQIAGRRPAGARRRRHRVRGADERRPHRPGDGGRRRGRPAHRGPGQPEALRALDGTQVVDEATTARRIKAAVDARRTRPCWSWPAPTCAASTGWRGRAAREGPGRRGCRRLFRGPHVVAEYAAVRPPSTCRSWRT